MINGVFDDFWKITHLSLTHVAEWRITATQHVV